MGPLAERIFYLGDDLRLLLEGDLAAVESPELLMGVLQELSNLDVVSWHEVLRQLKGDAPEVHDVIRDVKATVDVDAIRLRIGTVGHRVAVHGNGRVIVDLEFHSFGESPYRSRARSGGYALGCHVYREGLGVVYGERSRYAWCLRDASER